MIYLGKVREVLDRIEETQSQAIGKAAEVIAAQIGRGRVLHVFATGHSHMLAEELFFRAGGLVPINAIFEPELMLHEGATKSSKMEKLPGLAEIILDHAGLDSGDLLLVISNSGVNAVPVEMALKAKERGIAVIALTSLEGSSQLTPYNRQGVHLYEVADIVLDNCVPVGDACCLLGDGPLKIGPLSTIAGAVILNSIITEVGKKLIDQGLVPPVLVSSNIPGGKEHNEKILAPFRDQLARI